VASTASAKLRSLPRPWESLSTLDRLASFRVIYAGILAFVLLYFFSVVGAEALLDRYFKSEVAEAIRVDPGEERVATAIQERVSEVVQDSFWTRFAGVRVNAFVLGANGTPLYVVGRPVPPPPDASPGSWMAEAERLLPARAEVVVSVPHNALLATFFLVLYGAMLVVGLFRYNRAVARREAELLRSAVSERDAAAGRAREIEREIEAVRERLRSVEPAEQAHSEEIHSLERERQELQAKLRELADREAKLRTTAARSSELEQERQALEELLEEAMDDLSTKEETIQSLEGRLKKASKSPSSRTRGADQLARRLRTLYKNLEFDDRAVHDLVALGDETMKLKAEESIKRLADESEHAAVRRKVGGLPPQLSIFELGFAGKGRIYYTKGRQRRHRILAVGAKNTQKPDLEYLSRLSPD